MGLNWAAGATDQNPLPARSRTGLAEGRHISAKTLPIEALSLDKPHAETL